MSPRAKPATNRRKPPIQADSPQPPAAEPVAVPGPDAAQAPDWTARLVDLLLKDPPDGPTPEDLSSLWSGHVTGEAQVDETRLALLGLLARRQAQQSRAPRAPDLAPLPDWPDPDLSPLPPFHPTGAPGTSLIILCHGDPGPVLANLPSWLSSGASEVLLVDLAPQAGLAALLPASPPNTAPILRLAQVEGPGVNQAQGWNVGVRLARHQRLICLSASVPLPSSYLSRPAPGTGRFRLAAGPVDGSGFLLDLDRRDMARVGGFNEYLSGSDFALDELAARLLAAGLGSDLQGTQVIDTPPPPQAPPRRGILRDYLTHHPALASLRNRHVAALMPDWQGNATRGFGFRGHGPLGPHLAPLDQPGPAVPLTVQGSAEAHALSDLLGALLGVPVLIGSRRLDLVLSRPVDDVTALDVAVAASHAPDSVRTRRAWLVVDFTEATLPRPESPAAAAFAWLRTQADQRDLSLVLRLPDPLHFDFDDAFAGLPHVPEDPALTKGYWPVSLRDLLGPANLPHARLLFDQSFLNDLAQYQLSGPVILNRRPKLFIDVQHGLGNRLRAMASAAAIARATGRELVVIWQPDAHCECRFEDLYEPQGAVISEGFPREAQDLGLDLFNYMEIEPGSAKGRLIQLGSTRDAYLRSAYPLVHPASTWESENAELRQFRPNEVVQDLVHSLGPSRPSLSVHIRMEGGRAAEHLAYESPENWTAAAHREIDHWRQRSHFRFFQARIDQILAAGQADTIFLASDTPSLFPLFQQRYGDRVSLLARPGTDRSVAAMTYALADALLLSRAPRLLGSTWSSFTELAARLATGPIEVELSGRDF